MDELLKQRLLVTYGFMRGLNGKPIGTGFMGSVETLYVPSEIISPLEELLFPKAAYVGTPVNSEKDKDAQ